ncbi:hypothetical protein KW785_02330 [Candidatus Parcubacteria bacterium]|nr:hypothetical protein [Candidatus Parcubacteria bacterium]
MLKMFAVRKGIQTGETPMLFKAHSSDAAVGISSHSDGNIVLRFIRPATKRDLEGRRGCEHSSLSANTENVVTVLYLKPETAMALKSLLEEVPDLRGLEQFIVTSIETIAQPE